MSVVLDANALVVLALDARRASAVEQLPRRWHAEGESVHAPSLLRYEVTSALARAVSAGQLPIPDLSEACRRIDAVPVVLHQLEDSVEVLMTTQLLERKSAYDAAYIVLAQHLDTEVWTFDGKLVRNAEARGLPVRMIEAS